MSATLISIIITPKSGSCTDISCDAQETITFIFSAHTAFQSFTMLKPKQKQ